MLESSLKCGNMKAVAKGGATSARAAALCQFLQLATFLVTETTAHSGGGLGLEADSAAAASGQLLEYGTLSMLWPVLASFRRATHAVISSDGFSPADAAGLVEALTAALMRLLFRSCGGDDRSPHPEPRDRRATAACLELLPALCSAGVAGLTAGRPSGRYKRSSCLPCARLLGVQAAWLQIGFPDACRLGPQLGLPSGSLVMFLLSGHGYLFSSSRT